MNVCEEMCPKPEIVIFCQTLVSLQQAFFSPSFTKLVYLVDHLSVSLQI